MRKIFTLLLLLSLMCCNRFKENQPKEIMVNQIFTNSDSLKMLQNSKYDGRERADSILTVNEIKRNNIKIQDLYNRIYKEKKIIEDNKNSENINNYLKQYDKIIDSCYNSIDSIKVTNQSLNNLKRYLKIE